jgi:hypothetical protein
MKTKYSDNGPKHSNKYKGLRPFTHSRKGWKEDAATEEIKYENAVGGVLFDEKLLVLEGNELPELFVIWKIAFMNRIYNHSSLQFHARKIKKGLSSTRGAYTQCLRFATSKVHGVCTPAPVPCLTG